MRIPVSEARQKLIGILATSGASKIDVETMVEVMMEYDFHNNTFSGFSGIEYRRDQLRDSKNKKHRMMVNKPSMKLIDANGRSAILEGVEAVDLVCDMAKKTGIAMVGIYNATYHEGMEAYARKIAARDLVGIVSANGGPAGVVPYGGTKAIFGTNPIAYGIPSNGLPIVFDAATGKYPYGSIRIARKLKKVLPESSYFDKEGHLTTDPEKAVAIVPFGEHKGYAINLLLEVMTGCLVRAKSGLSIKSEKDLGSFFIAIDPSVFGPMKEFKANVSKLIQEIKAVKPMSGFNAVYVPGHRGEEAKQRMLKEGYIEVADYIWNEFEELHKKTVV
ncbi:MAG: Ldh family oxidoreductase [Candidatus Gottesmanbacteria bacterium]|nr:Ldh family oxidoreductase [Candidatus Gottesmanbacteria bacterium]